MSSKTRVLGGPRGSGGHPGGGTLGPGRETPVDRQVPGVTDGSLAGRKNFVTVDIGDLDLAPNFFSDSINFFGQKVGKPVGDFL